MGIPRYARIAMMLASFVLTAALPAAATPIGDLHYLVGSWKCTYHAGAMSMAYDTTYAYNLSGQTLREIAAWAGGGDEELVGYDPHAGWTAVVFDDHGNTTVMHATGHNPNHIVYHSVYPDASIAVTFDRISATKYTTHGTVRTGGKTISSVDTCTRVTR